MSPPELQFVAFVTALMEASPRFTEIRSNQRLGDSHLRPDVLACEAMPSGNAREVLVECKSLAVLPQPRVEQALSQLALYREALPNAQVVFAFPGVSSPEMLEAFAKENVEVWDLDRLGELFAEEIEGAEDSYYGLIFRQALKRLRPERKLIQELKDCPVGLPGWSQYQKLIGRILETLFCPPLSRPFSEKADHEKVNRRDFIFPNYASDGFWLSVRQRYGADYVLVDAKNNKGEVTKSNVLQIANYLKPHGVGLFALIVARNGPDRGAKTTMREQWLMHSKLIVVLDDKDVRDMLLARMSGGDPADVVSDKIQTFRLEF